jgi:hypothetical protein
MNVVVLSSEFPSSAWRRSFADALIRLRPDMNPDVADELSDSAFLSLGELEPGGAAAHFNQGGDEVAIHRDVGQAGMAVRGG